MEGLLIQSKLGQVAVWALLIWADGVSWIVIATDALFLSRRSARQSRQLYARIALNSN
jgi:hypothetical protein